MNYTSLKANIQDICETTFTDDQLALFTDQAEQKIYNTVQIPALRRNVSGALTSGNKYLSVPTDFLYTYSLAVLDSSSVHTFLINISLDLHCNTISNVWIFITRKFKLYSTMFFCFKPDISTTL